MNKMKHGSLGIINSKRVFLFDMIKWRKYYE